MISNYNASTGEYETPRRKITPTPDSGTPPKPMPTPGGDGINTPDSNRWSDYLAAMLGDTGQGKGYRGSGYRPEFSQQYQDYVDNMYGRVGGYMDDPRGYSDEEYAMMSGRGVDALTARGGGFRQMMEDAQKNRGFYGGSLGNLEGVGRQTSQNIADLQRNIALSDMDIRRQQAEKAMQLGIGWQGAMSDDEKFMVGQKGAAASRGAGLANRNLDYIRNLQRQIGQMDIQEQMYRDTANWANMGADMQYPQYPTGQQYSAQDPRRYGMGGRYSAEY